MADAHARVSGRLSALVTSTGPGAANAAGAMVEARFWGAPLLHIAGQTATGNIDRGQGAVHDVPQQLDMLDSVSKAAWRVRSPETALGALTRAAAVALTPPTGPVSVEIPIDIQRARIPRPATLDSLSLARPAARPAGAGGARRYGGPCRLGAPPHPVARQRQRAGRGPRSRASPTWASRR